MYALGYERALPTHAGGACNARHTRTRVEKREGASGWYTPEKEVTRAVSQLFKG